MKALTVKQPWASLIAAGFKDVENRSRRTHYRGPLAIHVAQTPSRPGGHLDDLAGMDLPAEARDTVKHVLPRNLYAGHVIAIVDLVDCVQDSESPWAFAGHWHWVLANPSTIGAYPTKGRLGLWDWEVPA